MEEQNSRFPAGEYDLIGFRGAVADSQIAPDELEITLMARNKSTPCSQKPTITRRVRGSSVVEEVAPGKDTLECFDLVRVDEDGTIHFFLPDLTIEGRT